MKPTRLTPGCTQETGHKTPHGDWRMLAASLEASLRSYHGPPSPPVTLEGLAAVISSVTGAVDSLASSDAHGETSQAHLAALIAKAREVACGKGEMTAGEAARAVHQRISAMPDDELERHAEAIAARDDAEAKKGLGYPAGYAAGYNRAVIDAANVLPDIYGTGNEDVQAVKVQHGIMALHKAGVGEMRMEVTQVDE